MNKKEGVSQWTEEWSDSFSLIYICIIKNCVNVNVSFILNQQSVCWGHQVGAKLGIGGRVCLGGAWPKKLDTFVPCFRVRALKATAWMGFLFIQCNQEAVTSTKCPSVPLSSTQRRVHFNLEDHRNGIKYAKREINSSNCTVCSLIILPSLQSKHNT